MIQSLKQFAKRHNLKFNLSSKIVRNLETSSCDFCSTKTKQKTYQNVGLHKWNHGFIDCNVFSLCNKCYKIRNGQSKEQLLETICCILFRIPVKQKMKYKNPIQCRKYKKEKLCKSDKCMYCYSRHNLSFNKIDPYKSYETKNAQTLCWTCNRMKSNLKEVDFFSHLHKLCLMNYSSLKLSMSNASDSLFSKNDSSKTS